VSTSIAPETSEAIQDLGGGSYGVGGAISDYWGRLRGGNVGSLPAVLGAVVLVIVFTVLRPDTFTKALNFANLIQQGAMITVMAMGLVFVLLLGEIDLAAGATAGVCGAVLGVMIKSHGWPWWAAIGAALISGVIIGMVMGLLVSRLGIPSFVVTLAFFLSLQGVQLAIIGEGGTVTIQDKYLLAIMNNNLSVWLGWVLYLVGIATYGWLSYARHRRIQATGVGQSALSVWALKLGSVAVILGAATYYLSVERSNNPTIASIKGIPEVVVLLVVLLVVLSFLLGRTPFGRHVYAVGGNTEAARRAGIGVATIKLICFIICSTMAATAGILFGSRNHSISPSTGGGTVLLLAVAAAVIGGTSLFGGKGRVIDAVIGGFVVSVIQNGMNLMGLAASYVYIFTGLVLLLAASVDAISRRRSLSG
jgi:D-xylose transport system permease protein